MAKAKKAAAKKRPPKSRKPRANRTRKKQTALASRKKAHAAPARRPRRVKAAPARPSRAKIKPFLRKAGTPFECIAEGWRPDFFAKMAVGSEFEFKQPMRKLPAGVQLKIENGRDAIPFSNGTMVPHVVEQLIVSRRAGIQDPVVTAICRPIGLHEPDPADRMANEGASSPARA